MLPLLVLMVLSLAGAFAAGPPDGERVREDHELSLSGIYLDSAWYSGGECSAASIRHLHHVRALEVVHTATSVTLRVPPTGAVRVMAIERERQGISEWAPPTSGVARWEGDELAVYTVAPAAPLWGRLGSGRPGILAERFWLDDPDTLVYAAFYTPESHPHRGVATLVRLSRCGPL